MAFLIRIDPGWAAEEDGEVVVVYAGADLLYEVQDLDAAQRRTVCSWFVGEPVVDEQLGDRHQAVVSLLTSVGAVRLDSPPATVSVQWVGDIDPSIADRFISILNDLGVSVATPTRDISVDSDRLLVLIKTNVSMYDCALVTDALVAAGQTHLFCDVGFDHTITIGPTVVPGRTACVRCLAERVGGRWNDTQPPAQPHAVPDGSQALAMLVGRALRRSETTGLPFVNEVVTLDLDRLSTTHDRVFRNPWCSACSQLR